jgi:nicotinate-nucleotide pyrophosphorylase (carboxylating)
MGHRDAVHLAFGGGVRLEDLTAVRAAGADAADIGRAILDAPLLDLRMTISGPV